MKIEYGLNDIVEMKKSHPCATRANRWQIIRLGADIKIRCSGCGNIIMLTRGNFEKSLKKILIKNSHTVEE